MTTQALVAAANARTDALRAASIAAAAGIAVIWLVGFASPAFLHEAAHDTRHAFTFPCH